jgi:acetyl esterase/lipase
MKIINIGLVFLNLLTVHNPPNSFFKNASVNQFKIANTTITEIKKDSAETNLLLFVHGGAFIAGPNQLHWNVIKKLSKETKQTIWVCDYPKADLKQFPTIQLLILKAMQ